MYSILNNNVPNNKKYHNKLVIKLINFAKNIINKIEKKFNIQ